MAYKTREEWLMAAAKHFEKYIKKQAQQDVQIYRVSVGFPLRRRGKGAKAIGQCFTSKVADDQRHHMFISPVLSDAFMVLNVLLHEMIHATVGIEAAHKGPFITVARACGLVKPWTATMPNEECGEYLKTLIAKLGPYPHGALNPLDLGPKKQGTRLRLYECECGIKVRVARDDFNAQCLECDTPFVMQ